MLFTAVLYVWERDGATPVLQGGLDSSTPTEQYWGKQNGGEYLQGLLMSVADSG